MKEIAVTTITMRILRCLLAMNSETIFATYNNLPDWSVTRVRAPARGQSSKEGKKLKKNR